MNMKVKTTKKLFSIILALAMMLAMVVTASAATINITGNDGEIYTAYKVLDVSTATNDEGNVIGYSYTTTSSNVATLLED